MKKPSTKWILIALAVVVVAAFVYSLRPANAVQAQVDRDSAIVNARFTPSDSVDVAMAMKILVHDEPSMLHPPEKTTPMLLYPPSTSDLERLSGE